MNKIAYLGVLAVPALVLSSCSTPEERAVDVVKGYIVSLTKVVEQNNGKDLATMVDALDVFLEKVTPELVREMERVEPSQRLGVLEVVGKSEELKQLLVVLKNSDFVAMLSSERNKELLSFSYVWKIRNIYSNLSDIGEAMGFSVTGALESALDSRLPF
jgi:hypothetical protein